MIIWKSRLKTQHSKKEDHGIQSYHFMANRWANNGNWQILFSWAPKSLWTVTAAMKVNNTCSLEENLWQSKTEVKSRGITLLTKLHIVKAMIYPVVMYGYESWIINKAESESESRSAISNTLQPHGLYSPWSSLGQNTGWVAFPFSRGYSRPRDWTQISCMAGGFFTNWAIREALSTKELMFQTLVLVKTLESPLDSKEIKSVNPKGNQPWLFTGQTDAETEAPMLLPQNPKSRLIGKYLMLGEIEGRGEGVDRGWDG